MSKTKLYNHISPGLSDMEKDMLKYIKPGGNWKDIPDRIKSKRLDRIRETGGRTTYYGRLLINKPSYTITTYFNRLPNSSNIHPEQDRMISIREGARLQSFPDDYKFVSSITSQYKQIGNAVPPLLGRYIARQLKKQIDNKNIFDLFAGAGGMSIGFLQEGYKFGGANEIVPTYFSTFKHNHKSNRNKDKFILGDITDQKVKGDIINLGLKNDIGLIIGGPPCQGFSLAGWRDPSDVRNQLFRDYLDVVKNIQPEAFIMENVPGILTMKKGMIIQEIMSSFSSLGYNVSMPILMKAEEFGVPQRRRRVILVGSKKRELTISKKPMFSYEISDIPDPINVGEAIGCLPKLGIKDGVEELMVDYKPISAYEKFIMGLISFKEFYSLCFDRKKSLPQEKTLFS